MLPNEMIKEFIDKVCAIIGFEFQHEARIIAVEDNWLKIKDSSGIRIINGDMIKEIRILPDKHQNKFQ